MRPAEKKQYDRQNKFNSTHYDRVGACMPRGTLDRLRAKAKKEGMSVNAFLKGVILEALSDIPEIPEVVETREEQ